MEYVDIFLVWVIVCQLCQYFVYLFVVNINYQQVLLLIFCLSLFEKFNNKKKIYFLYYIFRGIMYIIVYDMICIELI